MQDDAGCVKEDLPFVMDLSLENLSIFIHVFEELCSIWYQTSFSYISHSRRLCRQFLVLFHILYVTSLNNVM